MSAAELSWKEVGSFSFKSMKVGASSDGKYIALSTGLFDNVGLKGTGNVTIMKEGDDVFARATATATNKYVALSCLPREALPISSYRITFTYRFSEGMVLTNASRGFVARMWDGNSSHTHDKQVVTKDTDLTGYTKWRTETVEIETKYNTSSIWFFVYTEAGEYFDVKDISISEIAAPQIPESVNYDASTKADLVINSDLRGHVLDKIDDWSDEANVKVLDPANYVIGEDGKGITFKREFMQTLKPGAKSFAFNIEGIDYIVVVNVYNSTVADPPVKAGKINVPETPIEDPVEDPIEDPAEEPEQNNGTVIAIAAGAVAVIAAAAVTAVVVKKKKKA